MSRAAFHTTARDDCPGNPDNADRTVPHDTGSSRTFAYVRSRSFTSTRSGRGPSNVTVSRPPSDGTSRSSRSRNTSRDPSAAARSYKPSASRCGRAPRCSTSTYQRLPSDSPTRGTSVSTPVVRSHARAHARTSRCEARASESRKSPSVALPNRCRTKCSLIPARKLFSPSHTTNCRSAAAPFA
ncbi:hypothetical protein STAL104432_32230 [Streptomyces albus]